MFRKLFKQQKGITLTEVVVYIGIISIVVVSIVSIVVQLIQLKASADSMGVMNNEITNLFEKLITDVRNCDSFAVDPIDSSILRVTTDGSTNTYSLQNSKVILNDGLDNFQITSNLVLIDSLTFSDWTSTSSDNLLHLEVEISRGGVSEDFQTSIHKR